MSTKNFYTVKDVAELIGLKRTTVYRLLWSKKIKGKKVKYHDFANKADLWQISPEEFERVKKICNSAEEEKQR